ncbi:MAG: hypothetical protein ABI612_00885 [Betaproteobacteria bacterium]
MDDRRRDASEYPYGFAAASGLLIAPSTTASVFFGLTLGVKAFSPRSSAASIIPAAACSGDFYAASSKRWSVFDMRSCARSAFSFDCSVPVLKPEGLSRQLSRKCDGQAHLYDRIHLRRRAPFATPLVVANDFYLRLLFMIGVYYLAAAGLSVLVGFTGQKMSRRSGCHH